LTNGEELPDFSDVKDEKLRVNNRGAILANIVEDYILSTRTASYSYKDFNESFDSYLSRFPKEEQRKVQDAMKAHLAKRGYGFGS